MTPTREDNNIKLFTYGGKTYKLDFETNRVSGYIDDIDSLKQMILKTLNTNRFEHIIYSWNWGNELNKLVGEGITYVIPEIKRYIKEALSVDDRIDLVKDFKFSRLSKDQLLVEFTVDNIYGEPLIVNYVFKGGCIVNV